MSTRRLVRTALLAFSVGLGGWGAAPAGEPTAFPPDARQRYEQGRDLQTKGQLDEAVRAFEEAIRLGMDAFPRVHLQEAGANLQRQRYDTAVAQYTKFIERFGLEESCRS
jgi:outer membrane protein assembly factor BamD (BamD/ComL family)